YFVEGDGLWIKGDAPTEILIRTEEPLRKLTLVMTGAHADNDVTASLDGRKQYVRVPASGTPVTLTFEPRTGIWAHGSYGVLLHLTTSAGFVPAETDPHSTDKRFLGVFVRPKFVVADPPR